MDVKKSLASLVTGLKKQTQNLQEELRTTRQRIDELDAEFRKLTNQPMCKEDFKNYCLAGIDTAADEAKETWVNYLEGCATEVYSNRPRQSIASLWSSKKGHDVQPLNFFFRRGVTDGYGSPPIDETSLFFLFRDQIKNAIAHTLDEVTDWPHPDAKPFSDYLPELERIQEERSMLIEKERELFECARELKVPIPQWAPHEGRPKETEEVEIPPEIKASHSHRPLITVFPKNGSGG